MPIKRYTDPRLSAMWGEPKVIEFTVEEDEFVVNEAILSAKLTLRLSGSDGHDVQLESVWRSDKVWPHCRVPTFVWDLVAEWVKRNQPLLQSKYRDAMRDQAEAA